MDSFQTKAIHAKTFQNATGKIDYTLTNDYMFWAVLQKNAKVLKELSAALLHLPFEAVQSADILNPIEPGESFDDKTFVLDVKVLLNNSMVINLEIQVLKQDFWADRSLSYLCAVFNNIEKRENDEQVNPAYHIVWISVLSPINRNFTQYISWWMWKSIIFIWIKYTLDNIHILRYNMTI